MSRGGGGGRGGGARARARGVTPAVLLACNAAGPAPLAVLLCSLHAEHRVLSRRTAHMLCPCNNRRGAGSAPPAPGTAPAPPNHAPSCLPVTIPRTSRAPLLPGSFFPTIHRRGAGSAWQPRRPQRAHGPLGGGAQRGGGAGGGAGALPRAAGEDRAGWFYSLDCCRWLGVQAAGGLGRRPAMHTCSSHACAHK